jgi:hypothetical protein
MYVQRAVEGIDRERKRWGGGRGVGNWQKDAEGRNIGGETEGKRQKGTEQDMNKNKNINMNVKMKKN